MDASKQFKVSAPVKMGAQTKEVVDTRWALTWEEADGKGAAKARPVAKSSRGPDLRDGRADPGGLPADVRRVYGGYLWMH